MEQIKKELTHNFYPVHRLWVPRPGFSIRISADDYRWPWHSTRQSGKAIWRCIFTRYGHLLILQLNQFKIKWTCKVCRRYISTHLFVSPWITLIYAHITYSRFAIWNLSTNNIVSIKISNFNIWIFEFSKQLSDWLSGSSGYQSRPSWRQRGWQPLPRDFQYLRRLGAVCRHGDSKCDWRQLPRCHLGSHS